MEKEARQQEKEKARLGFQEALERQGYLVARQQGKLQGRLVAREAGAVGRAAARPDAEEVDSYTYTSACSEDERPALAKL